MGKSQLDLTRFWEVREEMLAEQRANAHDDDSVGVVFSVRDHEESHSARSR
jgi:hypothetical protein